MAERMVYKKVSLSRLADCFKKEGFTREMLLETFITLGWLVDSNTVTVRGIEHGIRQSSSGPYLVYGQECWDKIYQNIYKIQKHFNLPLTVEDPRIKQMKLEQALAANASSSFCPSRTNASYPYLGIDNFLIIDTETTGNSHQDEVVEIGIIDMCGNVVYEGYFMPEKRFTPAASSVNHLNKQVLKQKGARLFKDEWPKIVGLIKGHVLLGHNLSYDKRMIVDTCKRYDLNYQEAEDLFIGYYDSKNIAKKWIISSNYKLDDLSTMLGITWAETHDATDDCRMTLQFLDALEDAITKKVNDNRLYSFLKT